MITFQFSTFWSSGGATNGTAHQPNQLTPVLPERKTINSWSVFILELQRTQVKRKLQLLLQFCFLEASYKHALIEQACHYQL